MNAIYLDFSPYPDLSSDFADYRIARDAWLRQESDDEDDEEEEDDDRDEDEDDEEDDDDENNGNDGYSE